MHPVEPQIPPVTNVHLRAVRELWAHTGVIHTRQAWSLAEWLALGQPWLGFHILESISRRAYKAGILRLAISLRITKRNGRPSSSDARSHRKLWQQHRGSQHHHVIIFHIQHTYC
jgi:hypothetical protein